MALVLTHGGDFVGGAPLGDLVVASMVGLGALAALSAFGFAHRTGRTRLLTRIASFSERVSGLPGWAALPAAITGGALLVAVFGFYWDVATHIDDGRDPGPFANPAHFLIIGGLAGIALAGVVAILLGRDDERSSVRLAKGWHAPIGGVLLLVCGGIAVLGFPLDDVWHRIFGQDVTLWSPTHIQMVGGAALSTLALWLLLVEGGRATPARSPRMVFILEAIVGGSFLVGLSALQAEFDYSVPQFRLLYHPILLAASAAVALVAARMRLGRGGAVAAVAVFLIIRGLVSLLVGPIMGHTTLHFPLYIVEALVVEAIGSSRAGRNRSLFGAVAGLGIGTLGVGAEWGWSHLWMTMSWPSSLLPGAAALAATAGIIGGLIGGLIGGAFTAERNREAPASRRGVALVLTGLALVIAYPFFTTTTRGTAMVTAIPVPGNPGWATVDVRVDPASVADGSEWFNVTAWQGGGSVVVPLEPRGVGRFETGAPVPVSGHWKTLIRLHQDRALMAVPVYLPADPAISAEGVSAPDGDRRALILDKELLLREAKDVSPGLIYGASFVLAVLVALWIAVLVWGVRRVEIAALMMRHSHSTQ